MKIIDLFNKIANGEEVPKKIKYKGVIRVYNNEDKDYISYKAGEELYLFYDVLKSGTGDEFVKELNNEVEIIEEDKEIEEIGKKFKTNCLNNDLQIQIETIQHNCALAVTKIDEIVRAVNELKRGKENE